MGEKKVTKTRLSALPRACNQFPWWITRSARDTWKPCRRKERRTTASEKKKKNDHRSIIDRVVALLDFQRRTVNATPIIARESNSLTTSTERKRARFEKQIKKSKIKKKKKRKSVIVLIITCFQRRERASQNRMQIGNQSRAVLYWKHTLSSSSSSSLSRFKQFLTSSPFRRSRSTGCVVSLRRNNEPFAYRIAVYRQLSST